MINHSILLANAKISQQPDTITLTRPGTSSVAKASRKHVYFLPHIQCFKDEEMSAISFQLGNRYLPHIVFCSVALWRDVFLFPRVLIVPSLYLVKLSSRATTGAAPRVLRFLGHFGLPLNKSALHGNCH